MNLSYSSITVILLVLISCKNTNNSEPKSKDSINNLTIDTPKYFHEELTSHVFPIDSSKLIKAFDDIYFGTKSKQTISSYLNKTYSISNTVFDFDNENYYSSEEFGLYKFRLTGQMDYVFKLIPEVIEDIENIIESSYPKGKKIKEINESPYGMITRGFQTKESGTKKIPEDYLTEEFIYQYTKHGIGIKVGYQINFRPENYNPLDYSQGKNTSNTITRIDSNSKTNYIKFFKPIVSFTLLSEYSKVERKEDSIRSKNKTEFKKKEVSKF